MQFLIKDFMTACVNLIKILCRLIRIINGPFRTSGSFEQDAIKRVRSIRAIGFVYKIYQMRYIGCELKNENLFLNNLISQNLTLVTCNQIILPASREGLSSSPTCLLRQGGKMMRLVDNNKRSF